MAAAQEAYDAVHLLLRSMFASHGDLSGPALKAALETPTEAYRGVVSIYDHPFSPADHDAFSLNMIWMGLWHGGEIHHRMRTTPSSRVRCDARRNKSGDSRVIHVRAVAARPRRAP